MLDRRRLLAGAAFVASSAALPAFAKPAPAPAASSDPQQAAALDALMEEITQTSLRREPELATALGLDKGDLAWTKSLMSDESLAAVAEGKAITADQLKRLRAIDRSRLQGMDAINYDTVEFSLAVTDEMDRKFAYGPPDGASPYVVSQLTGAYFTAPDFMDNQHGIETREGADAYIARMAGIGRLIDQETELSRRDAGLGVVPPDFVIDKAMEQMRSFLATPTASAILVASLARRTREKGIQGDWASEASKVYVEAVKPALERQLQHMQGLRSKAVHDAGVWRLPEGLDYYAVSTRQYTTSSMSPDEIFRTGQELVASLGAQADALMKKQGLTRGTVGERLHAMFTDPKFIYPDTDEGKQKLVADLNVKVAAVQAKLPQWFGALPKAKVEIHRVPKEIEAGAPSGYYNSGSLDGSRPGIFWINLRDTAEWPSWDLPTLVYHEAIPGHHLQGSISNEAQGLPLLRKILGNSGYLEGWALYAEQLAVEMGMYDDDPYGHIGQLHDAMLRAVRMVVDSGMHAKHWSREQAIGYYTDNLGDKESGAVTEIERYCVWPGQACSYMLGKLTILQARDRARKALGRRFDIRSFHDVVLLSGAMPLDVLSRRVDEYVAAAKA
jgi:uncharacterized protein (DUF885 family)